MLQFDAPLERLGARPPPFGTQTGTGALAGGILRRQLQLEPSVDRKTAWYAVRGIVAPALLLGGWRPALAQDSKGLYPSMAPLGQYLMDRATEIAMARSAAPTSISAAAEVWVLGPHGYETAAHGTNGFVCVVERGWMSPFDAPQFWNPKLRGPICFNPPAARTVLPLTFKRTALVLAGLSKGQMIDSIRAFGKNGLPALEPGGMSYMMSSQAYLDDSAGHWIPHLMFYVPLAEAQAWGADLPGSPVMLNPQFQGAPEPIRVFMVPLFRWSDGTVAAQ